VKKKNRPGLLKRLLVGINSLLTLLLFLSYLSYYIPPSPGWLFGVLGLTYPALLIANILFIVFWTVTKSKYLMISLIGILAGWNHIDRHYGFGAESKENDKQGFKVITYNIKTNRYSPHKEELIYKISDYIKKENPKILCLQECFMTKKRLQEFSKATSIEWNSKNNLSAPVQGLFTFSHMPVIDKGFLQNQTSKFAIYHDLLYNKDTFRIYNMQLASIKLQKEKDLFDQKSRWQSVKSKERIFSMFRKFNSAYNRRTREVRLLKEHLSTCPYPVVLCGDFNDTPLSYAYHNLSQSLTDPFNSFGKGFGNTHNENLPPIRIDYILHDKSFEATWYEIDTPSFSDHFPVIATLEKNR